MRTKESYTIRTKTWKKLSSLSSYRSSGDPALEDHYEDDSTQDLSPKDYNNKLHDNMTRENDSCIKNKDTTTSLSRPNIHQIVDRLYPGSDVWVCRKCTFKGDRYDLLSHPPYCKQNKK